MGHYIGRGRLMDREPRLNHFAELLCWRGRHYVSGESAGLDCGLLWLKVHPSICEVQMQEPQQHVEEGAENVRWPTVRPQRRQGQQADQIADAALQPSVFLDSTFHQATHPECAGRVEGAALRSSSSHRNLSVGTKNGFTSRTAPGMTGGCERIASMIGWYAFSPRRRPSLMKGSSTRYSSSALWKNAQMRRS